jgi:hypothetical protein
MRTSTLLAALFLIAGAAAAEAPSPSYILECQGCHLSDGTGLPGVVPSLANSVASFLAVPGGREYLVRVPGSAQSPLSDPELAAVLNWMVRVFGPAEQAQRAAPFTAEEVARYRGDPLVDVEVVRRELLRRIDSDRAGMTLE